MCVVSSVLTWCLIRKQHSGNYLYRTLESTGGHFVMHETGVSTSDIDMWNCKQGNSDE